MNYLSPAPFRASNFPGKQKEEVSTLGNDYLWLQLQRPPHCEFSFLQQLITSALTRQLPAVTTDLIVHGHSVAEEPRYEKAQY